MKKKINLNKEINSRILGLSLPAIAGLSSQMIVSLVDTAMVGRLQNAEQSLAAMGIGLMATWAVVSFFSSFATGTHIIVARRFGSLDYEGCGLALRSSLLLNFFLGIIGLSFGLFLGPIISNLLVKDYIVEKYASVYLQYRFLGMPFFLLTVGFRGFYFGIGITKIFMIFGTITNFLNIFFNYIFIYGNFGAPQMGLAGAGLGSSLALAIEAILYFIVSSFSSFKMKYSLFKKLNVSFNIIKNIINISLPVSFQNSVILIGFLSFLAITGLVGVEAQAASQLVISCLFISFIPCYGFGIALQTLVSNSIGAKKYKLARLYVYETAKIASLYVFIVGVVFFFFPYEILRMFTHKTDLINIAVMPLKIIAIAQLFYGFGSALANALQSCGKTFYVMITEVISNIFILVPAAYLLAIVFNYGIVGAWLSFPIYIISYLLMLEKKFANLNLEKVRQV